MICLPPGTAIGVEVGVEVEVKGIGAGAQAESAARRTVMDAMR